MKVNYDNSKSTYVKKKWSEMTNEECIADYYGQKELINNLDSLLFKLSENICIVHTKENICISSTKQEEYFKKLETYSIVYYDQPLAVITKEFALKLTKMFKLKLVDLERKD